MCVAALVLAIFSLVLTLAVLSGTMASLTEERQRRDEIMRRARLIADSIEQDKPRNLDASSWKKKWPPSEPLA